MHFPALSFLLFIFNSLTFFIYVSKAGHDFICMMHILFIEITL